MGSPVVTPVITQYLLLNSSISASELFSVVDPDGDAITRYRFKDSLTNLATGFFRLAGVPQSNGQSLTIGASELTSLEFVAGSQIGSETITISAKDLTNFGNTAILQIYFVKPNITAPNLNTHSTVLLQNESVLLSSLLTAFDPDGWPIQRYFLKDSRTGTYSGRFITGSGELPQAANNYVLPADFANLVYSASLAGEVETIYAYVFDGAKWSELSTFTITTIANQNRPTAQFNQINVPVDRVRNVGDAFTFFDPDGNTLKKLQIFDTNDHAASGNFKLNGTILAPKQWHTIDVADVSALQYTGAKTDLAETARFKVYDGRFWSNINDVVFNNLVRPILNYEPIIFFRDLVSLPFVGTFFTKGDSGPNYARLDVIDLGFGVNTGRLVSGGQTLAPGQIHSLTGSAINSLRFNTGLFGNREFDTIMFRVDNGTFTSPWEKVEFRSEPALPFMMRQANGSPDEGFNDWDDWTNGNRTITYSFMQGFTTHDTLDGATADNFSTFTLAQRNGARTAFSYLGDLINVTFQEVSDFDTTSAGQGGIIRMANYTNPPPDVGTGLYSGYTFAPDDLANIQGGDIWINLAFVSSTVGWQPSGSGLAYSTFLQLLAGAMGEFPSALVGDTANPRVNVGAGLSGSLTTNGAGAIAPQHMMLFDIYALQDLYGAKTTTRTDDDVYSLENTWFNDPNMFWTVWDGGGNDTISGEGDTNGSTIDLREGQLSSIGFATQNIGVAFNTKIENAFGSDENDTLTGNGISNVMTGNDGNDTIWGNGGDDFLFGGRGSDNYRFDIGDDNDVIDEQRLAGVDRITLGTFPSLNSFSADISFRREFRNLIIDLTLDGGESDGTITIKDQRWGASRVETLVFNNGSTTVNIDLTSVYAQTTNVNQSFKVTTDTSSFGFLVAPV